MSKRLSVKYKCCGGEYGMSFSKSANAVEMLHALDTLHDEDHPECKPLAKPEGAGS